MNFDLEFELRYLIGDTPWDSGVTPPELIEFINNHDPGRALEFGCGTGTNAIRLAEAGWQVDAVDFSLVAILNARMKAQRAGVDVNFKRADAARAGELSTIQPHYDLGLDIGCFHALDEGRRQAYAAQLPDLIAAGGSYLLYSFLDQGQQTTRNWPKEADILAFYEEHFSLAEAEYGHFNDRPSAWFTFRRHD